MLGFAERNGNCLYQSKKHIVGAFCFDFLQTKKSYVVHTDVFMCTDFKQMTALLSYIWQLK